MGLAANNRYIGEAPKFMDQRVLQSGIDITIYHVEYIECLQGNYKFFFALVWGSGNHRAGFLHGLSLFD